MRRFLFFALIALILSGCLQPEIKEKNIFFNKSSIKKIPLTKRANILHNLLEKMVDEGKLVKTDYNTYVYDTKKGKIVIFQKYDKLTIDYPQDAPTDIITEIKARYYARLLVYSKIYNELAKILQTDPSRLIYIDSDLLNPNQKKRLVKYVAKKAVINIKDGKVCIGWNKFFLRFKSLQFEFSAKDCYDRDYVTLDDLLENRVSAYLYDAYFMPKFTLNAYGLVMDIDTYFSYDVTNFMDRTVYLTYRFYFKNLTSQIFTIRYLRFFYFNKTTNYPKSLLIQPFYNVSQIMLSKIPINECRITNLNKNNILYGISFMINDESFSYVESKTFDQLFEKYVK